MNIQSLQVLLGFQINELAGIEQSSQEILNLVRDKCSNNDLIAVLDRYLLETKVHQQKLKAIAQTEGLKITISTNLAIQALRQDAQELLESTNAALIMDIIITGLAIKLQAYELAAYEIAIKASFLNGHFDTSDSLKLIQMQSVKVAGLLSKIIEGYQLAQ